MEPRGRGRGVGRGRGGPGQQQQQQQRGPGGPRQQPQQQQQRSGGGQPQQSAWVRPPQPRASQAWPRPPQQQPQAVPQPSSGRGSRVELATTTTGPTVTEGATGPGNEDGNGKRGGASGGGLRGRTVRRNEILFTRPSGLQSKNGSTGRPIKLTTNYLQLISSGKFCLYQYRVDFSPDVDVTPKRKAYLRTGVREILKGGYLFDGTVLYVTNRINPDPLELFVDDDAGEKVRITIRLVGDLAWGDFHYLQLFNIIMRKCLYLMGLKLVGRNYFSPHNSIDIPEYNIQLWPGFYTSMRQHERDILLNVDLQFKFMRMDNVYDVMMESQGANFQRDFTSKIVGGVVLTHYNNKTYRIDDVDFNLTPDHTFQLNDGSQISYREYYKKKYNVEIRMPRQPLLISRSKPREIRAGMPETVILVPELCRLTGLTDRQRDNFTLMKALGAHTRVGVEGRVKKLIEFAQRLSNIPECLEEIRRWDLNIARTLVELPGRVLNCESILSGNDMKYTCDEKVDWTNTIRSRPMFYTSKMERLAVICPSRSRQNAQGFVDTLAKCAQGMRWSIGSPRIFDIPDDRTSSYLTMIDQVFNSAHPTMILIILTTNSIDRYSAIKKKCCVDLGIPTQVFLQKNLTSKGVMSIATKVAVQMSCKIGGAPWTVIMPLPSCMVVGYDVCRDTANKKKSFSGMVASLDRHMTRYYSCTAEHELEEEISDNFATFLLIACKKFKEQNGQYPERICIYRDGVGDGQIPYVFEHEVTQIKKKLTDEIYKNNDLKMAFIIVSKRINTKFFLHNTQNPPSGTVIDDVVTLPERYDFFIISQCVRQGTVGPTSYNVIDDNIGLTADRLQILTYKLTHMYYNWFGTVRVPAPCQYAHKLAFLTSQSLHRPAHRDLENVLYYL